MFNYTYYNLIGLTTQFFIQEIGLITELTDKA